MKLPTTHWEHSRLTPHALSLYGPKLEKELVAMQKAAAGLYEDDHCSINLPLDLEHLSVCQKLAAKYKDVSLVVVIGIGGSNRGTQAVQEAVLGRIYNLNPGKRPRIMYAVTVDPSYLHQVKMTVESELKKKKKVLINVVSKSGTTETVANFAVFVQLLKKYRKDYKDYIVVTTDEESTLWHHGVREGYHVLSVPKKVGGRYSVFSAVGLFPLAVIGINIKELLDGAAHMRAQCLKEHNNPAMIRAAMLCHAWAHGRIIADNFYFKTDFEGIGKWYRQLMGESIGKEWNKEHSAKIWVGMTPTVSIGTTDLHSHAQLYFGGPDDKFFTLVTVKEEKEDYKVPKGKYDAIVQHIEGKQFSTIMHAISLGVQITLQKQERPFCHIELVDSSEFSIGALLQLHMMEMMYLAALLDVNAFDQPNVEAYKIETKKILARRS